MASKTARFAPTTAPFRREQQIEGFPNHLDTWFGTGVRLIRIALSPRGVPYIGWSRWWGPTPAYPTQLCSKHIVMHGNKHPMTLCDTHFVTMCSRLIVTQ